MPYLAGNKFFNSYANRFSKRARNQGSTSSTSTSSTSQDCIYTYISNTSYSCSCTFSCPSDGISSVFTTHIHDDISSCITTITDCDGGIITITSTPNQEGTRNVVVVGPQGNTIPVTEIQSIITGNPSYYHGVICEP